MNLAKDNWLSSNTTFFWGEIAPSSHVLQLYENNDSLLNLLEGFVVEGIRAADAVVIICTEEHLNSLEARLIKHGLDVKNLREDDQYIPVNAHLALSDLLINGALDLQRFDKMINSLMARAQKNGRKVRAFGEMVAILWEKGKKEATIALEHLWNEYLKVNSFCLYCAYPADAFTENESLSDICCSHTMLVEEGHTKSQIRYTATH